MATSSLRFAFSPLINTQITSKFLFSNPNFQSKSIKILYFSSSIPATATALETLAPPPPPSQSVNNTTANKWEPYRKKKVVMRVGYVEETGSCEADEINMAHQAYVNRTEFKGVSLGSRAPDSQVFKGWGSSATI